MKVRIAICTLLTVFFMSIPFGSVLFRGAPPEEEVTLFFPDAEYTFDKHSSFSVKVLNKKTGKTEEKDICECIANQIIRDGAENYGDEAIKAIALTIYTDMLYDYRTATQKEVHSGVFICTNCALCNDISKPEKEIDENNMTRILSLTSEIIDRRITCGGVTIQTFRVPFSSGKTESAKELWGKDIKYLKSENSPWDKNHPSFSGIYFFSYDEFYKTALKTWGVDGKNYGGCAKITDSTNLGNVKKISVFGKEVSGSAFCLAYGIKSLNFKTEEEENGIKIISEGTGSSVGLSEYGAECLAKEGYSCEDIIKYYFNGVNVTAADISEIKVS